MNRTRFIQIVVAIGGIFYILTALTMLFAPRWFFFNIGHFEPFNRHYMGDLGTFIFALGIGLLIAARDPFRHRLMIGSGILASFLHTLNHVYDAALSGASLAHWMMDVGPLLIFVGILAIVYAQMPKAASVGG